MRIALTLSFAMIAVHALGASDSSSEWKVIADPQDRTRMLDAYFHRMSAPRPPRFVNASQWDQQRQSVRRAVLRDLGLDPLPERVPLNARVVAARDYDDYRLERIWFQSLPDVWASGWLYLPRPPQSPAGAAASLNRQPSTAVIRPPSTFRFPAVLNPHGHWENGARHPVVQSRCIGLAKLGYVAFAVDSVHVTHWALGVCSVGMMTWNNMRALDYLETRPEVDATRIGCTGASGGGQQAMYLMAVDDRIQAAVPAVLISYFEKILFPTEQTH